MKFLIILFSLTSLSAFSQVQLLNESFQGGQIPSSYTIVDNDTNDVAPQVAEYISPWIVVTDPDSASNYVAASTSFLKYSSGFKFAIPTICLQLLFYHHQPRPVAYYLCSPLVEQQHY